MVNNVQLFTKTLKPPEVGLKVKNYQIDKKYENSLVKMNLFEEFVMFETILQLFGVKVKQ